MKYKYIGSGDSPPEKTNFMGQYHFVKDGEYVDVTDPVCLRKIKNNPCFQLKVEVEAKIAPKKVAKKKVKP